MTKTRKKRTVFPPNTPDEITRRRVHRLLKEQGLGMKNVAIMSGVTTQCVSQVFRRHYPRIERNIARLLDTTPQDLWPHRYGLQNKEDAA